MKLKSQRLIRVVGCIFLVLFLVGCAKSNNSINDQSDENSISMKESESPDNFQENQAEINESNAIEIAKEKLSEEVELDIITNYENPEIETLTYDGTPEIFRYENTGDMIGKKVYLVTFHTTEDDLLGPITFYIDMEDGQIYGSDYRE